MLQFRASPVAALIKRPATAPDESYWEHRGRTKLIALAFPHSRPNSFIFKTNSKVGIYEFHSNFKDILHI